MIQAVRSLSPEDRGRLLSYTIGAAWGIVFITVTPSTYSGVVSHVLVWIWSGLASVGCVTAIIGVLTRRDLKVELPGLYAALVGGVLYWVAQAGFAGTSQFHDRIALLIFILWHLSMLLPRIFGLEAYRKHAHVVDAARRTMSS